MTNHKSEDCTLGGNRKGVGGLMFCRDLNLVVYDGLLDFNS